MYNSPHATDLKEFCDLISIFKKIASIISMADRCEGNELKKGRG